MLRGVNGYFSKNETNLNKIEDWAKNKQWRKIHDAHYDWWMFPISRKAKKTDTKYTVFEKEINLLKKDEDYMKNYERGVALVVQSWGWNIKKAQYYPYLDQDQKWNLYDVRLGKMANSLILFKQWELYDSLRKFFLTLKEEKISIETWVEDYFTFSLDTY